MTPFKTTPRQKIAVASTLCAAFLALAGCQSSAEPKVESQEPVPTAGLWKDATAETIGTTGEWTNKVELADLNGDGLVDILFANGGNYREPGDPVPSRIFLNQGPGKPFREATEEIFGSKGMLVRVIKTVDVNADGHIDIFSEPPISRKAACCSAKAMASLRM